MPIEKSHDPRTALVRTKYFSLHPKPLERWLWQQGLPQAAERVFWLHWEEGMRSGDWCSEIPIRRVARECAVDASTVTRAYQVLKTRDLIRREDPGRDPHNPFLQATAVTEVRLPRELVIELARSPNRPEAGRGGSVSGAIPHEPRTVRAPATHDTPQADTREPAAIPRPTRQQTQAMWNRASEGERARFFTATRDRLTSLEFDPETRLTAEDRGQILALLAQQAAARPAVPACSQPTSKVTHSEPAGPRRLSTLDRARARRSVLEHLPAISGSAEVLRQVLWAMEEGALRKFAAPLALNIALKKIREGAWTKPHRMPPNWMLAGTAVRAVPEQCSAA
jgi:hypothetical protein